MSSQQQQPRQWFRFGSFFQGAQQQQPRQPPPTTPTQQPAIPPPARQPAQETQRAVGAPIEVPALRFPITPAAVSTPSPALPTPSRAATITQIPQPTQIARPAGPQPRPFVFQPTPRGETPPGPPARTGGASNEATIMRSVVAPMPPSAPALSYPGSISPPQVALPHSPPPPLPPTNGSTPYSSPMSRTPPSMQTSPSKGASPGTVLIRFSSLPKSPVKEVSESTSLLTSPVPEPPFPAKSSNQDRTPKASPEYVNPMSDSIKFRQFGNEQAEQKSVLVQETLDRSRVTPNKGDLRDQTFPGTTKIKNGVNEKGKTIPKKLPDSGKSGTRLILDGVNMGAIMDLNNGGKKDGASFRGNGKKLGSVLDEAKKEASNPNHKKGMPIQSSSMRAFINNNVQGINNSIAYNSSCIENDPGVHLSLSIKGNVDKEDIQQKYHSK